MLRPLFALVAAAAAALALTACGEKEEKVEGDAGTNEFAIAGDYSGRLTQKGLPPFLIGVRIAEPTGTNDRTQVAYTGINCGGDWRFDGLGTATPAVYEFTEQITQGKGGSCKGSGTVTLTESNGPEELSYVFSGGGVQSSGVIRRTTEETIAPIFAQAGVVLD